MSLIAVSIFGVSFRPVLSVVYLLLLHTAMRVVGPRVLSVGALSSWVDGASPLPSLFVTGGGAPVFFSLRIAITALAALELLSITLFKDGVQFFGEVRARHRLGAAVVAGFLLGFTVCLMLALRAVWSFDVVITLVVARLCGIFAHRDTPWFDVFMP